MEMGETDLIVGSTLDIKKPRTIRANCMVLSSIHCVHIHLPMLKMSLHNLWSVPRQTVDGDGKLPTLETSTVPAIQIFLGEPSTDSPFVNIGQAKLLSLSQFECFDCNEVCDDPLDNDGDGLVGCADQNVRVVRTAPVPSKIVLMP